MKILYQDEDGTVLLQYVEAVDEYFIHTHVYSWSLSKYKKYIKIFGGILADLREQGITNLKATPVTGKDEKWEELFGFVDSGIRIGQRKVMELDYGT